jgi:hypothetical protein
MQTENKAIKRAFNMGINIKNINENVSVHRKSKIVLYNEIIYKLRGVKFSLPDGDSNLIYYRWPDGIIKPMYYEGAEYQKIRIRKNDINST